MLKSKVKGEKFEKKVRKSIMSGGLSTDPCDLSVDKYAIECKYTDKKSYSITLGVLDKAWSQALSMNKIPRLVIGIKRNDKEMFILNCDLSLEKKDR